MRAAAIIIYIFLFGLSPASAESMDKDPLFKQTLQSFTDIYEDARQLVGSGTKSGKSTFETLTFREPKYVRLLDKARNVLEISEVSAGFDEISKLRLKNRDLEIEIDELKRRRLSAPEESLNPFALTIRKIDSKVTELQQKIIRNNAGADTLKENLSELLASHGLNFSGEEIEYFLLSAEGGELMRLMTMADNMKRIQAIMEQELASDPENTRLARIYAGMYLMSLDAYSSAHDIAINNLNGYRARLEEISREAKKNYNEAKTLRRNSSSQEQAPLDANIRLNEKTLEAARLYGELLERRTENIKKSRSGLGHKIRIARNTYNTLVNGSALVDIVNNASSDYALLVNFEMPELKNLHEEGMKAAFADISERIRAEN